MLPLISTKILTRRNLIAQATPNHRRRDFPSLLAIQSLFQPPESSHTAAYSNPDC